MPSNSHQSSDFAQICKAFVREAPVGFAVWDGALKCRRMNDYLACTAGRPASDCLGQHMAELFPDFAEQLGGYCHTALRSGRPLSNLPIMPCGRDVSLLCSVYCGDTDTEVRGGCVGTMLVEVPSRCASAAEAERCCGEAHDRVLSQVSHDLRTPTAVVFLLLSELLRYPQTTPAARTQLRIIQRNLELQNMIVDDLQEAVRVRHGQMSLNVEPLHLHETITEAARICRPWLEGAKLTLSTQMCAREDTVVGDVRRLLQLLWNLLQNAGKYTLAGGSVLVRTFNRGATKASPLDRIVVEVHDTGVGIDSAHLCSIFEPYRQENSTTGRGLGLGLSIARTVAELHSGKLTAFSEGKGRGSTFALELPLADRDSPRDG